MDEKNNKVEQKHHSNSGRNENTIYQKEQEQILGPSTSGLNQELPKHSENLRIEFYECSQGLKQTYHGIVYQLELLLLFLLEANKSGKFKLATEMKLAKNFDDVVLKTISNERSSWTFIQAKHKLDIKKQKITENDLFQINSKQNMQKKGLKQFSLKKYFESFCKIINEPCLKDASLKVFLICTNVDFDENASKYFSPSRHPQINEIINVEQYQLNSEGREMLMNELKQPNDEHFKEFVENFRFIVKYEPSLHKYISKQLFDSELVVNNLKQKISEWLASYEQGKCKYLTGDDLNNFLEEIREWIYRFYVTGISKTCVFTYNNRVKFNKKCLLPLELQEMLKNGNSSETKKVLLIDTLSPTLFITKVKESVEEYEDYIFITMSKLFVEEIQELIFRVFAAKGKSFLLFIHIDQLYKMESIFNQLNNMLCEENQKKIIIITKEISKHNLSRIKTIMDVKYISDSSTFQYLDKETQKEILQTNIIFQGNNVILGDLIDTVTGCKLIDDAILELLLNENKENNIKIGNKSEWCSKMDQIHISRTLTRNNNRVDQDALVFEHFHSSQNSQFYQYNIIANDPGYGKSEFLTSIASYVKEKYVAFWVFRINLIDYVSINSALKDITFSEKDTTTAIDFILNLLIPENNNDKIISFERQLLLDTFNRVLQKNFPRIVLLFDDIDNVFPKYEEQTKILLTALQNTNTEFWITTRPQGKIGLEQSLKVSALQLNPFTRAQKQQYFDHFLKLNKEKFGNNLNTAWEILEKQYLQKFTDIPLHFKMLIQAAIRNENILKSSLNLSSLYEQFITLKFNIYYGHNQQPSSELRERDLKTVKKMHENIAAGVLFPNYFNNNNWTKKYIKDNLEKIGFFDFKENGYRFIHETFAEFFLCEFIQRNINKNSRHFSVIQSLLTDQLLVNLKYGTIRRFLYEDEKKHKIILRFNNLDLLCSFLRKIVEESDTDNILTFLKLLRDCGLLDKIKEEVNNNKHVLTNRVIFEIIHALQLNHESIFLKDLLLYYKQNYFLPFSVTSEGIEKYKQQNRKMSLLQFWASYYFNGNESTNDCLNQINEMYNRDAPNECFLLEFFKLTNNGKSIFHLLAVQGNCKIIRDILNWVRIKTGGENYAVYARELLFMRNGDNENVFHELFKSGQYNLIDKESLRNLIYYIESYIGFQITLDLAFQITKTGETLLHYAVRKGRNIGALSILLSVLSKTIRIKTTREENLEIHHKIKNFILKMDRDKQTALHMATNYKKNSELFKAILNFADEFCTSETILELLHSKNTMEQTVLHHAVVYKKNMDVAKYLLGYIERKLLKTVKDKERINEFILTVDNRRETALHCSLRNEWPCGLTEYLLDWIRANCDLETFKIFVLKVNENNETSLDLSKQKSESVKCLKESYKFILDRIQVESVSLNSSEVQALKYFIRQYGQYSNEEQGVLGDLLKSREIKL